MTMIYLEKHLNMLGLRVEDRVTGFKGVAATVAFDLYGCIQCLVNPGIGADGKPQDSHWFDVGRLQVVDQTPVMRRPTFEWTDQTVAQGRKGPAEKPTYCKV
jgi:hypothetical protein